MKTAPTLQTERLILCSLTLEDAQDIQRLAGERDVAATVIRIPHPYEEGWQRNGSAPVTTRLKKKRACISQLH